MRAPTLRTYGLRDGECIVDNFAGGGGASIGLEGAIGRPCDAAINHNPDALAMHRANHPGTRHYCEDVFAVDPIEVAAGRPVGVAWFSPDCTHFSRAKGGAKVTDGRRGLAWVVLRWIERVRPRVLFLENVQEFQDWGPLVDGRPDKSRAGETFRTWVAAIRDQGYNVQWRAIVASEYGAPTTRKRLFLVARCDGGAIVWPKATHGEGRTAMRTAAECIDWTLPAPSIFDRKRPLAEGTLRRIAEGIERFVIGQQEPFIVRHGHYSKRTGVGLVKGAGAGTFRGQRLVDPLATVCATNDKNLVLPWLVKHNGGVNGNQAYGQTLRAPMPAVTARDSKALAHVLVERGTAAGAAAEDRSPQVSAFLAKYYGAASGQTQSVDRPMDTVTSKARFALVEVAGTPYRIVDVGMRMLAPRELATAQGFPADYELAAGVGPDGEHVKLSKTKQTHMIGNSVCPDPASAIVRANLSIRGH